MTPSRILATSALLVIGLALAGCNGGASDEDPAPAGPPPSTSAPSTPPPAPEQPEEDVVGTVVHFTAGETVVEVTIVEDTPTTRDFLSMLPMTLPFEDYAGMETITYPEREFDYTDAEGMTPRVGDLFSYRPWGNLGFFYDTGSLGYSEELVRIGTTDDLDAVMELDGQDVTIDIAG